MSAQAILLIAHASHAEAPPSRVSPGSRRWYFCSLFNTGRDVGHVVGSYVAPSPG